MQVIEPPPQPQAMEDAEHIRMLSIFHYVLAGLAVLAGFFPAIYLVFGVVIVSGVIPASSAGSGGPPPDAFGWMFVAIGALGLLMVWGWAVSLFLAGRWIAARKNRTFCFVVAAISCAGFPLGTALGVFTIMVLQRPSVRALFDSPSPGGYLNR